MMQVTAFAKFVTSHPCVGGLAGPSPAQAFFCHLVCWPGPSLRMPLAYCPPNPLMLFLTQMAVHWGSLWDGHNLGQLRRYLWNC